MNHARALATGEFDEDKDDEDEEEDMDTSGEVISLFHTSLSDSNIIPDLGASEKVPQILQEPVDVVGVARGGACGHRGQVAPHPLP